MIKKLKYLLILLFAAFFFIPKDTYAISATGTYVLYEALGNYNVQPAYDPNYGNSHNISSNFPSNWQLISGSSNDYYTVVKQIYILLDSDSQFNANTRYKITMTTEFGSYITWTDFYGWRWTSNRTTHNCTDESTNSLNVCSITWNPTNDTSQATMELVLESSTDTDKISVYIGSIGNAADFVFWNRLGQAQGFKISTINIEAIGGGGSSTDLTETNEKIDEVNDNLESIDEHIQDLEGGISDVNDTLTDDTPPTTSDFEDFLDDIDSYTSTNPLGELMTLPITFVNTIYGYLSTQQDDGCERIKLMTFSGPWFDDPYDIYLPCFEGRTYFGVFWDIIDYFICFYMGYNIIMLFIHVYEEISTLSLGASTNAANTGTPSCSPYGKKR